MEDILNTDQRPKTEFHQEYMFVVLKMLSFNEREEYVEPEQVSFILRENLLVTFREKESDVFDLVYQRLQKNRGIIRKMGADYLAYALIWPHRAVTNIEDVK